MRIPTTLCGLVLSLSLAGQKPAEKPAIPVKPVTEDYVNFSAIDPFDSTVLARLNQRDKYRIPQDVAYVNEIFDAIFFLDAVKVPDWDVIFSSSSTQSTQEGSLDFSTDSTFHLPNQFLDDAAYFYFRNGSDELFSSDTADVKTLGDYHHTLRERGFWSGLSPYDTKMRFTIEGRADKSPFKGFEEQVSDHKNYVLSAQRSMAIGNLLKWFYPQAEIEVRAFGNAKPLVTGDDEVTLDDLARQRVVKVIPGKYAIECALEEISADYTYGDCSNSMLQENGAGYPPLEVVMLFPYENGNVFLYSDRGFSNQVVLRANGYRDRYNHVNKEDSAVLLTHYTPAARAQTPTLQVMMLVALTADSGSSHRFITDGYSSPSRIEFDHILEVAKKRDIEFSFIGTNDVYAPDFRHMQRIADETGGKTYFPCDPEKR